MNDITINPIYGILDNSLNDIAFEFIDRILNNPSEEKKTEKQKSFVKQMLRLFYNDEEKVYYYLTYMESVFAEIMSGEYDVLLLVAKKGKIVFEAFSEYGKYVGWDNIEDLNLFTVNSRTMCSLNFIEVAKFKEKPIEDLKIFVFDDTLNEGRNALSVLRSMKTRGVIAKNITYASPTINQNVLMKYEKNNREYLPKIFVDSDKLCNEYNNIDKNEIGIYKRKRRYDSCNEFLADNRNFELKAKLFIPNIGEDMEYENRFANFGKNYIEKETPGNSYSFVVKNEIVSRAYQLNQLAHFVNIPYTAYLAYTNSTSEITNDKIWNFLNKTSEKNLLKDSYPMFEVRKVRMKVCQTVGIDSRIIVLDFDVNTGAYAAIRILKNKDGTTVFFPIVVQKPMKEKDLRSEYERVFVKKGDLFNDNFHKIEDEEWKTGFEYFQKDKQADQGYEYKEKCEKENCETAYIRLKAVYECAARRLTNIKSGLLLYDFFNKLKVENVINNKEFDELIENLSKCIREQFLSIGKNTENEEKIKKYFKNIYSKHKLFDILNVESDNIEEEKIDYLDDIYMNCGFRCHPDDSAETYRHLTALLEKYKETPYRRIKNSNNIKDYLYLIFCQEFGAFFNKLKDNDNMEHKIPPLSTHYLINMVFDRVVESEKELKELNIDNIDDKNMIVSCVTALLSVMEDGFGGSVVYAEPVENCPKNESFYIYDCVQHGEDPIQVNELFFSDFLCLHNLLEYSIKNMYKYLGKIDDKIAKQLKKKVLKTVQNFTNEFSEEFKYKDFIIEINKFEFYIDSSFSSWNSGRYEKYDISGGEGIYRSEIYTELSPEFENNFPNDENIKNFIEDIYEVKEKILKKI